MLLVHWKPEKLELVHSELNSMRAGKLESFLQRFRLSKHLYNVLVFHLRVYCARFTHRLAILPFSSIYFIHARIEIKADYDAFLQVVDVCSCCHQKIFSQSTMDPIDGFGIYDHRTITAETRLFSS